MSMITASTIKPNIMGFLDVLGGIGSSLFQGFVGDSFQKRNLHRQLEAAKELTQFNNQQSKDYTQWLSNFSSQDAINKRAAYMAAGLNPAAMAENSFSPAQASSDLGSAPSGAMPSMDSPMSNAGSFSLMRQQEEQRKLTAAQTERQRIENLYMSRNIEADLAVKEASVTQINANIDKIREEIPNLIKDGKLKDKQAEELDAQIKNLSAQTENIKFNQDITSKVTEKQLKLMTHEINLKAKENDIKGVEASLARLGIMVGSDWITNLLSVAVNGKAPDLIKTVFGNLKAALFDLLPNPTEALQDAFNNSIDSIINSVSKLNPFK